MLPHLRHNIPRLGTMTVMPIIRYYPKDIQRMRLLADIYAELMVGRSAPRARCARCSADTVNTSASNGARKSG